MPTDATPNRHVAFNGSSQGRRRPSYLWGVVGAMSLFVGTLMIWPDQEDMGGLRDADGLRVATAD